MSATGIDEKSIKKAVAHRAKELGDRISHREVTLVFMDAKVAPRCRVFHAWWGAGEAQRSLSGLIRDEEAPDTYPGQALGKIFQRWLETEGKLPDPRHTAMVSAYLLDASGLHKIILSDEDRVSFISRPEWLPHVRLPENIEVTGQPGVIFWWVGPDGASQMCVYLTHRGQVYIEEMFIRDFLKKGGSDA
jgi:hypothetical protein